MGLEWKDGLPTETGKYLIRESNGGEFAAVLVRGTLRTMVGYAFDCRNVVAHAFLEPLSAPVPPAVEEIPLLWPIVGIWRQTDGSTNWAGWLPEDNQWHGKYTEVVNVNELLAERDAARAERDAAVAELSQVRQLWEWLGRPSAHVERDASLETFGRNVARAVLQELRRAFPEESKASGCSAPPTAQEPTT